MANDYAQYRATKIESGLLYQDYIVTLLLQTLGLAVVQYSSKLYQQTVGESRTGVEIKHDEKFAETGNLWIEVGEKAQPRPGPYAASGIERDDNTWLYVIGNYDVVFGFAKATLRAIKASRRYPLRENRTGTSVGFLLPQADAERYAAFLLHPRAEKQIVKVARDLMALGRALHAGLLSDPAQLRIFPDDE